MSAIDRHPPPFSASRRALLLAGVGALTAGCASAPPPPLVLEPVTLAVTLVARDDVNPDLHGRPSPLSVRVFELRSTSGFDAADFFSLYDRDQATLSTELLAREQYILKPGETQSYTRKAQGDTRYLGVLAAYRDLEHSVWRVTATIAPPAAQGGRSPAPRQQRVLITFERAAVRIEVAPAA